MVMHRVSRRALMTSAGAAASLTAWPAGSNANFSFTSPCDPHPYCSSVLNRIAFGSCADQRKDQPVWEAVLEQNPDLFIFLGDNIYGDTRDMGVLRQCYAELNAKPGFKKLRDNVPIIAMWDDHDFGENDAGANYAMCAQSREVFLDFWGEPAASPRRQRDGVYASYIFGPMGQRVHLILPDLRTHRTPIAVHDFGDKSYGEWATEQARSGRGRPGPYARIANDNASMLGEAQWQWLEQQFHVPADVRIFASSLQVLADFPGWECWNVYAGDYQRLLKAVSRQRAGGLVFLSGDTHYGEISKLDHSVPYPLWDVTSSGLTEVWPDLPPNQLRQGPAVREVNFGVVNMDWAGSASAISLQVHDVKGRMKLQQTVPLNLLQS